MTEEEINKLAHEWREERRPDGHINGGLAYNGYHLFDAFIAGSRACQERMKPLEDWALKAQASLRAIAGYANYHETLIFAQELDSLLLPEAPDVAVEE